ncbi:MAG: phenylalanine--tRNA ligase subunit beta [Nanoarchaeota archaeon]|nr:phenylalanine--tRNA ligase subunit beta [Nanoarchaeota archaeon]
MTILTMNRKELEKKVGRITKEIEAKITQFGTPVEEINEDEVSIEIFPNRPDLLSLQNFARALNQYNEKGGVSKFKILPPEKDFVVTIDKSVKQVRPYTCCAIVKGMKFDDEKIKEIIDIQEKLHGSIGRKRKKLAIGIYPLEKIKLPIRFMAKKPEEIKFIPLEYPKELNGKQILRQHPTGREYADLLKDTDVFPIFIDANDQILSMPPIINSENTGRITDKTTDIFIECSGFNLHYLKKCINIIVSALYEMGGKVYAMNIKDSKEKDFVSPDMTSEEMKFNIVDVEKTLGIKLTEKEVKKFLERMGIGYENRNGQIVAVIPAYRTDILHWVDLAEEVAIAYGYENFDAEIPKISTIAEEDKMAKIKRTISQILSGLGLLETSSFHLTTKKNIKKMDYEFKDFIEILDSKTERDCLRADLMTNLLQILSENSNAQYPQKIFEMGKVFSIDATEKSETKVIEKENLAIALIDEKMNFTEIKQVLDYLFKMLNLEYKIEGVENPGYISGRVGKIIVDGKDIGFVGEIAPRVLKNWKIKMPVVAVEIGIGEL